MNQLSLWRLTFSCSLIFVFFGCRTITPSVSYYILNPLTDTSMSAAGADGHRSKTVGVNPIELPGYLNRVQMVKRTGPNELKVFSFHRWADFPDRMIQRVLGDNLQLLMADTRVVSAPWSAGFRPDVTVDLTFLELIGTTENEMQLSAVWTITGSGDRSPAHRASFSAPIGGAGFDALAAAHNRVLEALCRKIADTLAAVPVH